MNTRLPSFLAQSSVSGHLPSVAGHQLGDHRVVGRLVGVDLIAATLSTGWTQSRGGAAEEEPLTANEMQRLVPKQVLVCTLTSMFSTIKVIGSEPVSKLSSIASTYPMT